MAVGNLSKPARPSEAFTSLLSLVAPRLDEPGQELIKRAFALAEEAHHLQRRKSGEPYILHPIAVAELLGHMNLDASALAAALLHDVVEDTGVTLDDLRALAETGVDRISIGTLTKDVKATDFSMRLQELA